MAAKRITRLALFTAAALVLSIIESLLPPILPFAPGARMGLANLVTLVALAVLGYADAYIILIVRCLLSGIFGGNVTALLYSMSAGLASLTVQLLLYRFALRFVSIVGISLAGAAVHNCVQLAVASLVVHTNLIAMLPLMMAASAVAGLAVGLSAFYLIKYLPKRRLE